MMKHTPNETPSQLAWRLENLLHGTVASDRIPYVTAQLAYCISKIGDRFFASEAEFVDFVNGLDCSTALKADLMDDVRRNWEIVSRMQGRFSKDECESIIRHAARESDLQSLHVPPSLVPMIGKLLSFRPGGILADIACGHGPVTDEALEADPDLRADAIDMNGQSVNFTEMLLARHGGRGHAVCASAFDFLAERMWMYDKVFCFPPLGYGAGHAARLEGFRQMLPGAFGRIGAGCRSELLFALACAAAMKDDGRAVVLVSDGVLFNQMSGAVEARRHLLDAGYLACVVSLPPRMLERTSIGVSLLVLGHDENRTSVTMIDASDLARPGRRFNDISEQTAEAIVNAAYGFGNNADWDRLHRKGVPVSEIRKRDYDFSPRTYFRDAETPGFAHAVRFGDVVEGIERGPAIGSKDLDDLVSKGEGVCYYLSPGDIENGGLRAELSEMRRIPPRSPRLESGDLLLVRTGANAKPCVFEGNFGKPVVPSSNMLVCHLRKDRIDPWFLKAFFESRAGQDAIGSMARGTAITSISRRNLEDLPVPCPPLAEQTAIAGEYREKFVRFRALKREEESLLREMANVFPGGSCHA